MKKTKNPNVLVIRIKPELKKQVVEILQDWDMSIAQFIRMELKEFVKKNNTQTKPSKEFLNRQSKLRKIIEPL